MVPHEDIDANAQFIVRACNAHEELLAACKWLSAQRAADHEQTEDEAVPDNIRAAIAKAEGRA